jgi:hypothetical protein
MSVHAYGPIGFARTCTAPPPRTLRILRVFLFLPTEEEAFPMDELAATLMKRYKLHAFESKGLETGFSLG